MPEVGINHPEALPREILAQFEDQKLVIDTQCGASVFTFAALKSRADQGCILRSQHDEAKKLAVGRVVEPIKLPQPLQNLVQDGQGFSQTPTIRAWHFDVDQVHPFHLSTSIGFSTTPMVGRAGEVAQ